MKREDFLNVWNYFLAIEEDLFNTARYVEPTQEDVFSFEFLKIIILSCGECETVFKYLCEEISEEKNTAGNIGEYKKIILGEYPKITEATVTINRAQKTITPFEMWSSDKLIWWDVYQSIKHNRGESFEKATYRNAIYSLSALYILILYLAHTANVSFNDNASKYISSEYVGRTLICAPERTLPGV